MKSPAHAAIPIGMQRMWSEDFVDICTARINAAVKWKKVGVVDAVNIRVTAPPKSGIYAFVRKSKLEKLTPFTSYPLIVYVGLAKNLRVRLLKYVDDKRTALRYTEGTGKIRSGIRSMFRTYRDALDIYVFECDQLDLVSVEDVFIKIFDPIFNETQKLSNAIEESDGYLPGRLGAPEVAYGNAGTGIASSDSVSGTLGSPESAF